MKILKIVYVIAGILAMSTPQLIQADDKKPETKPSAEGREKAPTVTSEEREAKRKEFLEKRVEERKKSAKELGLNPEELEQLPPKERFAKVKEASEKKLAELKKKTADGTITDAEKETLKTLEERQQLIEKYRNRGATGLGKPPVVKPSDK